MKSKVRLTVLAVGRIRPPFADDAAHYQRLLAHQARLETIEVRYDAAIEKGCRREHILVS